MPAHMAICKNRTVAHNVAVDEMSLETTPEAAVTVNTSHTLEMFYEHHRQKLADQNNL